MTKQMCKRFKFNQFNNVKLIGGTTDYRELRGCYLEMTGHVTITKENPTKIFNKSLKQTKINIQKHISNSVFKERFITTPTIPLTFDDREGGFVSVEYTFFPKIEIDYKILKVELEKIASIINDEVASYQSMTIIKNKRKGAQYEKN